MLLRRLGRGPPSGDIVAALDIGTHKVCCLIAALQPCYERDGQAAHRLCALGFGHQRSQGIDAGAVVDLGLAQNAVAAALAQAEHVAGVRIDTVHVGVTCGDPRSRTFDGHVDLPKGVVDDDDIARLDEGAHAFACRDGEGLLTLNRIAFGLDATRTVREPHRLTGQRLHANHHAVLVEPGPLRNLGLLVESCHLGVAAFVPAAFTTALASTTEEERWLGVTCIDIGAGTTSIASFADGHFVHCASVPVGGQHVTRDIAHALALPLAEAERIKTLYGSLATSTSDELDPVPIAQGEDADMVSPAATRAEVGRLIARRMAGLSASVRARLDGCGIDRVRRGPVVLTGGTSQLMGLEAWAAALLERPVRVAAPPRIDGASGRLSGSVSSRAFACVVGLAMEACRPSPWIPAGEPQLRTRHSYLGRVEQWLRESF